MPRGLHVRIRARWSVLPLAVLVILLAAALLWNGLPPLWVFWVHRAVVGAMARQQIPGLSVAVAVHGSVRWSAGYGVADLENHVPARAETVYRWASVSKPVTAVAALQLAESGKLDLDAAIQTYVPSFPVKPWPVTARQLLAHLGGIRHYRGDERSSTRHYAHFTDAFTVFRDDPLVCDPGTKHVYTTYGYDLLGAAVEVASGRPYMDYVRENIFDPAGMRTARAADIEAIIPLRTRGYARTPQGTLRNSRPVDLSNKTPGGGLCGTVEDAARFAIAVQSGALLPKSTVAAMYTRQRTRDGHPIDYGLGWCLTRRKGRDEVWHAGHVQEASCLLYMLPDRGFAVALMANLEGVQLFDLAREIADAVGP